MKKYLMRARGWKVVRYWEEELKDWRDIGERLSQEIWDRAEELGLMREGD